MEVFISAPARSFDRVSATIPISLFLEGEDSKMEHSAYTVDFSHDGVRVRTSLVLFPGEMLGIVAWGDSGKAIPCRVVWAERSSVSGSLAGLEFLGAARS